jgi:hypothetical protein
MRPLSSIFLVFLSSLSLALSQRLFLNAPLLPRADCQYPAITSGSNNYIYFTSPNDTDFQFSVYTEWDRWYPNVLRSALVQAGFTLGLPDGMKLSRTDNCGWDNAGTVMVGGWERGTVTFKDITGYARPIVKQHHPAPQRPTSKTAYFNLTRPNVTPITRPHVSRQAGLQPFNDRHPLSYLLSYQFNLISPSMPQTRNHTLRLPRAPIPQGHNPLVTPTQVSAEPPTQVPTRVPDNPIDMPTSLPTNMPGDTPRPTKKPAETPTNAPTNAPISPRAAPLYRPQKETLDLIRTILRTTSPEADIALFLIEIVGAIMSTLFLFITLVLLSRVLRRLAYGQQELGEMEEGGVELEDMEGMGQGERRTPPPTYSAKPEREVEVKTAEVVRVVHKRNERVWPGRAKVGVPTSSSMYSRSQDGVTVY